MTTAPIQPSLAFDAIPVVASGHPTATSTGALSPQTGYATGNGLAAASAVSSKIMIVDDEAFNIMVVRRHLQRIGYENFVTTSDSTQAVDMIRRERPAVVLLDIIMPQVSGLDILQTIRGEDGLQRIPVLILTASTDAETRLKALELGATDFLSKPVDPSELALRLRNTLVIRAHQDHLEKYSEELEHQVRQRTVELAASRQEVIHCLARAAEFRDEHTAQHVIRVGHYAAIVARQLGFDNQRAEILEQAAQLHDVGKIGVSDTILLKPAKLDPEEFSLMQKHCKFGRQIIQPMGDDQWETLRSHAQMGSSIPEVCSSPIMATAAVIAYAHHEKWDGSGYPLGSAGQQIPLEGRIVAVADVFDALSSKRPYKPAFSREKCLAILEEGRATHFDPDVLDAFLARLEDILKVQTEYADVN